MNLGGGQLVNMLMIPSSSGGSWKSSAVGGGGGGDGDGGVSDQFPAGLRVLVVDDDPTCLMILENMLRHCKYEVTKCNRAEVALSFLRENKNGFDVVISDVHMPDMDGFKLLEHIGLEMDLPVIMMSADDSKSVVMKGLTHRACDYLIKPVRIEALRNIWQHVRKRKHEWKDFDQTSSADEKKPPEEPDYSSSAKEGNNRKNVKRRKDEDDEADERHDSSSLKKPKRRKDEDDEADERHDSSSLKKTKRRKDEDDEADERHDSSSLKKPKRRRDEDDEADERHDSSSLKKPKRRRDEDDEADERHDSSSLKKPKRRRDEDDEADERHDSSSLKKPKRRRDEDDEADERHDSSSLKKPKRRKDEDDEADERHDSSSLKKPRVVWSVELHQQFVAAVNQLGIDKAVPKKILELMNVPGLTRENVASHLQKYRLYLRRLSGSQHPGGYSSMPPLNGLDLQALAASGQLGQLPPQSLATLQAVALGRSSNSKSPISVPGIDQRNIFSFENPKSRYPEVQSQHLNNNPNNSKNLLPGIPTNMEPKQFASLHQSAQHSFGRINNQVLVQMGGQGQSQSQSQNQAQSSVNSRHGLRQPVLSNDVLTRGGYNPVVSVSQASSLVDFSMNQKTDSSGSTYSLGGSLGIPNLRTASSAGDGNLDTKVSGRGIVPSYDVLNDLNQNREWGIQDSGLTFDQPLNPTQVGLDASPPFIPQHTRSLGFEPGGQNHNFNISRTHSSGSNTGQQRNSYVKIESHNDGSFHNTLYSEQYGQDDLLAAILKQQQQQQEGVGQPENEFGFDGYALDDLPV